LTTLVWPRNPFEILLRKTDKAEKTRYYDKYEEDDLWK
jgi:hypothetical protein